MWLSLCVEICHRHQNRRLYSHPHSHESVIFFVFWAFIVFKFLSIFTRRVNMHLHAHKLCSAHELCTRTEPWYWSAGAHGVTTMLGVSLRVRRHTTQVMLGLSLPGGTQFLRRQRIHTSPCVARVKYTSDNNSASLHQK